MLDPGLSVHYESLFTEHQLDKRQLLKRCFGKIVFHCSFLVHGQVTIIFVVSCLFVCAEFFSAVFDPISIKLGHKMLYVWV